MSLELALRRLSLRPSSICHQCRRTLVSSALRQQHQSATGAFADLLQSSRNPTNTNTTPSPSSPNAPPRTTSEPDRLVPRSSYELSTSVVAEISEAQKREQANKRKEMLELKADLEKQSIRKWRVGDVYAPHDLTGVEQAKWKKLRRKGRQRVDVIDQLGINPIEHYKNFSMMSEYMSDMGRIKHGNETGLRPVNQRKMAKAVRRAIGTGLMPGVHRHPEILRIEMYARNSGRG